MAKNIAVVFLGGPVDGERRVMEFHDMPLRIRFPRRPEMIIPTALPSLISRIEYIEAHIDEYDYVGEGPLGKQFAFVPRRGEFT